MRVQRLESTDGFLLFDLDGAEHAAGLARLAPKVLQDSAEMLARSVTYSFATFELPMSGASAAINAKPDARDDALAAFVEEVQPMVDSGALRLRAGTGLDDVDLAPLGGRNPDAALTARGAVAAAEAYFGTLEGKTIAVAGMGLVPDDVRIAAVYRDAHIAEGDGVAMPADVLFVAGKPGVLDHDGAATVQAELVVPLSPVAVTSKAYATLRRAGITYIPDFVAQAAPLLLAFDEEKGDPVERVRTSVKEIAGERENAWLIAIGRAEAFLSTWQDTLPFGRPLAS